MLSLPQGSEITASAGWGRLRAGSSRTRGRWGRAWGRGLYKRAALHRAGHAWLPIESGAEITSDPPEVRRGLIRWGMKLAPASERREGGWNPGCER